MPRGGKQIEGQLTFEMCLNTGNYVVQSNSLVGGKQALSINSAKIVRAAIMQVVRDDTDIKPYIVTIPELSEILNISRSNLYRDIDSITNEIMESHVDVRAEYGDKVKFKKISWVSFIEYQSDTGLAIKLNNDLKPYLLNLKERYTQYTLDNILAMKSVYAIRIFELLQEKMLSKLIPKNGTDVSMTVGFIRECCGCEEKYAKFSHFKSRVLDSAVKEINRVTMYNVEYSYVKKGKAVEGISFHINMKYH